MHGKGRSFATIAILMVISVILCTGCKKAGNILAKSPDINMPFESDVTVQAGEFQFKGSVRRYGTGIWNLSIAEPETLAGLNIAYNDEGVKAELGGLELGIPAESIKDRAIFALIFKAFDSAASSDFICSDCENGKICTGEFAGGSYKMTFEPRNLTLTRLEIPSAGISVEFTDFRVMNGEDDDAAEASDSAD